MTTNERLLFVSLFEEEEKEEKESGKLNATSFFFISFVFVFVFFIKLSEGKRGMIGIIDSSAPIRRRGGRNGDDDDDSRGGNEDEEETKKPRENNNDEKEEQRDKAAVAEEALIVLVVISLSLFILIGLFLLRVDAFSSGERFLAVFFCLGSSTLIRVHVFLPFFFSGRISFFRFSSDVL